jgi:hypothetical protein
MISIVSLWSTHSCVPGRDSSRPLFGRATPCAGMSAGVARMSACATAPCQQAVYSEGNSGMDEGVDD